MSATLKEGQKLRRLVKVYGVGSAYVTLTCDGIAFSVPGTKLGIGMPWAKAVASCDTPQNLPSKFEGRPMDFLQYQAAEATKRAVKRLDKKETNGKLETS